MNQCWHIVNLTPWNKLELKYNQDLYIFIQENAFQNVICKMVTILSQPHCVNRLELMIQQQQTKQCKGVCIFYGIYCLFIVIKAGLCDCDDGVFGLQCLTIDQFVLIHYMIILVICQCFIHLSGAHCYVLYQRYSCSLIWHFFSLVKQVEVVVK